MSSSEQIKARQNRIAEEIAKLQKEHDELDVALRVLGRFSKLPDKPPKPPPKVAKKATKKALKPRPAGLPSTFEMVEAVLSEAEKAGQPALTSKELLDKIREKYWPGVHRSQILPSIFGFAPKRLTREGDKWTRKKDGLFG
jgi:hypothetical protein